MARRLSFRAITSISLRGLALSSRFVFVFAAAFWMDPEAFGIYGLIAAGTYVFSQIAGIEAFQIVMRRVARKESGDGLDDRPFYGRFIFLSAPIAFGLGAGMGVWFGWPTEVTLMAGAITAFEYLGVEAMRILVAENRADLSLLSVATRFVFWSFGFPVLTVAGIIGAPWPLDAVLASWLVSSVLALTFLAPIWAPYWQPMPAAFWSWYRMILAAAPRWIVVALTMRFLESGVRMVPGFMIDEVAAGHFVFLATLAGFGGIGMKAVVEPFFFARMVRPDTGKAARRRFGQLTLVVNAAGAVVSAVGFWATTTFGGRALGSEEAMVLGLLIVASTTTSFAQIPHFKLYAAHRDNDILATSLATFIVSVPLVFGLTYGFGLVGTSLGAAISGGVLLGAKALRAKQIRA
jgi:hypothetical protein